MTPVKHKRFNKLFQHYEQQQFSAVGTNATGLGSTFAKKLAQMNTAAKEDVYGAVNMTANNSVEFQVRQSDDETAATTCSIADTDRIVSHLEEKINVIPSNEQMRFNKELSIHLIKFEAWAQAIRVQKLWKTIEQPIIHFGCRKMHLVSDMSVSIRRLGSGDNFTTNISERLHIGNVNKAS
jgi:hypothetical protein